MIEIRHKTTHTVMVRSAVDSLNGKNLSGLDLTSADLSERSMCFTCFCRAQLRLADLSGSQLCNAVLDNANLEQANLSRSDLSNASLLSAQLRSANLAQATLRYALLTGADAQGANFQQADLSSADLRANLRDAILIRADLRGANLAGANLKGADLTDADLSRANLDGASLVGARIKGAKLDRTLHKVVRSVLSAGPIFSRRIPQARPTLVRDLKGLDPAPATPDGPRAGDPRRSGGPAPTPTSPPVAATHTAPGGRQAAEPRPGLEEDDRLSRWRNILRVRYLGAARQLNLAIKPGAEGVVLEFSGPGGGSRWQVDFPQVGAVYVPREDLEVLDRDFLEDGQAQQATEAEKLLEGVKETVLYSTSGGKFKSLVIWYSESRYVAVEEARQAEVLIRLCKVRRIRVSRDRWFN
jgi:uncharacterized protein YjbI with pentapeptide repeats